MPRVIIDGERCKGCELCIQACPKGCIKLDSEKLNSRGYRPAVWADESACIGCAFCGYMCPDTCITVEK